MCRCSLVTHRSNRVSERAQHATEISGMAGFVPIRQSGRVWWWLTHGCWRGFYGNLRIRAKTLQDASMRQAPPYSATLSNRNEPGHSRYLRGVLRALSHSLGPVDNQAAAAQSRRNLACILDESHTYDLETMGDCLRRYIELVPVYLGV